MDVDQERIRLFAICSKVGTRPIPVKVGAGEEPGRTGLDRVLQLAEERLPRQSGHDWLENLHHDGAWPAHELAPGPEQAGIEPDRHAGYAELRVEMRHAELVGGLGPWWPPRSLREDDELPTAADGHDGLPGHAGQRRDAGLPIDRDHPGPDREPTERRDPGELALEDEHRLVKDGKEREGLPQ
jgi:hypothetical protein